MDLAASRQLLFDAGSATPSLTRPATLRGPGFRLQGAISCLQRRGRPAFRPRILEQNRVEQKAVESAQHSLDISDKRYKGRDQLSEC